ncbi:hypothetical protein TWF696_007734 [Orbilia brochopaga]|uniref:Ribosome biogenesis protein SLX9 n=1 Tax=Orbilia brochopaga TaxID=3140254 RepID=A0AAV9UPS9_9PEZI
MPGVLEFPRAHFGIPPKNFQLHTAHRPLHFLTSPHDRDSNIMAPTKKRSSIRAKAAARATSSSKPTTTFADLGAAFSDDPSTSTTPHYQPSKRAKRVAKHTSFLHRVASTGLTNSSAVRKKKRSRGKDAKSRGNLVASLSSLADALPDFDGIDTTGGEWEDVPTAGSKMVGIEGLSDVNVTIARTRAGNIAQAGLPKRMKSLGTRRGMRRRKEKVEEAERRRFQQNVAVIAKDEKFGFGAAGESTTASADAASGAGAASGLQALRAFITRNMAVQQAL